MTYTTNERVLRVTLKKMIGVSPSINYEWLGPFPDALDIHKGGPEKFLEKFFEFLHGAGISSENPDHTLIRVLIWGPGLGVRDVYFNSHHRPFLKSLASACKKENPNMFLPEYIIFFFGEKGSFETTPIIDDKIFLVKVFRFKEPQKQSIKDAVKE